jgi:tetratricopeptide (TPR) repeat protein
MIRAKQGDIHNSLLEGNFVTTQAAVVKRECFEKVGAFDERLPRLQDWELWLRFSEYYHFKYIHEPLLLAYYTEDSISADRSALKKAIKSIFEKHHANIMKNRKLLAKVYCGFSASLYSVGEFSEAREYIIKALKLYPFNIKVFLSAAASLFGQGFFIKAIELYQKSSNIISKLSWS